MKGMLDRLASEPDTQVIVVQSQDDFDIVSRKLDKCVLIWDIEADEPHDFACLEGRDVIVLGDLEPLFISKVGCKRLRYGSAPIPAELTAKWVSANIDTYPPENIALRHVQPLIESTGQASSSKGAGVTSLSTAQPDPVDPDLDSITGGLTPESIPPVPEWLETPPEASDTVVVPIRESMQWVLSNSLSTDPFAGVVPVDLLQTARIQEIDLSILPPHMQRRHEDISKRTGCDPGIGVITDYCGYAVLCDDHYRAQPRANDWKFTQSPGFFSLTIGDSASRKSAAMEAALETVIAINEREGEKAVRGLVQYAMDMKFYEAQRADYVRENKKAEVRPMPPMEPEIPQNGVFFVKGYTPEGARDQLLRNPNGLLIYADEIAAVLGGQGKYSAGKGAASSEMALLLQFYDGGHYPWLRAGGNSVTVPNWKACFASGTTESKLREVLRSNDDGFLQRQLICVARHAIMGVDSEPDSQSLTTHEKICNNLQSMRVGVTTVLKFEPKAVELYRDFEARINTLVTSSLYTPAMRSCLARWTGTCARLALVNQLIAFAMHDQHARVGDMITEQSCQYAVDLLLKFQLPQQTYFWERVIGGRGQHASHLAQAIAKWIVRHERVEFSLRDMTIGVSSHWQEYKDQQVSSLRSLEDAGWIAPSGLASKNRPGLFAAYNVNPRVHGMYADGRADELRAVAKASYDDAMGKREAARLSRATAQVQDQEPPQRIAER